MKSRIKKVDKDYIVLLVIAIIGLGLTFYSFYPGFLNIDSANQLQQAQGKAPLTDWHPPGMSLLWRLLIAITGKMWSLFALQLIFYWSAFCIVAITIRKYTGRLILGLTPLLFAFLPTSIVLIGIYWKDVLMAAVLCLVAALLYLGSYTKKKTKTALIIFVVAIILIIYSGNLRHNVLPALIPLAYAASYNFFSNNRKTLLATIAIIALVPISVKTIESVFNVQRLNFSISVMVNDLKSILTESEIMDSNMAYATKNYVLGVKINCFYKSKTAVSLYECGNVSDFRSISMNDYGNIKKTWLRSIFDKPFTYIKFRTTVFWMFITLTPPFSFNNINNDINFFDGGDVVDDLGFGTLTEDIIAKIKHNDMTKNPRAKLIEIYLEVSQNEFSIIHRPYFWGVVGIALLVFHRVRLSRLTHTYVAMAILFSGLIYLFTYLLLASSYEYRYIYWLILSIGIAFSIFIAEYNKSKNNLRSVLPRKVNE